ncbi:spindle and kinetochore-associated protein 1 homolog [Olea europaea var. sylvestris]|uniref:spindle and kinetochore-associated protein 1 homolog n=1 Tax=Olea europaea var. sylvestris TaxID=158386 RepID=UPI000C1D4F24|nr:spindle and kinetochore-associated protein 1 homolog [Olea europaea var. sylvestris]
MDVKQAGSSLDSLISSFNTRISELQQFVIARNMYPASSVSDLSEIDSAVKGMEIQVQKIRDRLREETQAIPKAKKLIEAALGQQKRLKSMSACVPSCLPEIATGVIQDTSKRVQPGTPKRDLVTESLNHEEPAPRVKNFLILSGFSSCIALETFLYVRPLPFA